MENLIKLSAALIVAFFKAANEKRTAPRLYKVLFPEKKQLGLKLEFMKGRGGAPIKLTAHALDVTTKRVAIPAAKSISHEMPFFKNEQLISEQKRQELLLINPAMTEMVDSAVASIVGDFAAMPAGAEVNADVMMGQVLSTGTVVIAENDIALTFDYGLESTQKETLLTTAKWSDLTNSTPLADIVRWRDAVQTKTGEAPSAAILTRKTFNYMKNNVAIKAVLLAAKKSTSDKSLKELIFDETNIVVEVYNEMYTNADRSVTAVFPDEIITLLPAGNVGYMMYGTTPEEVDAMDAGTVKKDVVQCGDANGISVFVRAIEDPVTKACRASAIMLPSGENLHKIFIATVHS